MSDGKRMSPLLKYPGAKWRIADWIVSYMPTHVGYLEPFFGSGAVFFTKQPSQIETINDVDGKVVNLFRTVRERPDELARLIELTPWSRTEYYESFEQTGDQVEDARRFLVRCWQAFGAKLSHRTGWSNDIQGRDTAKLRTWSNLPVLIRDVALRLKDAQIECQPAVELIRRHRSSNVLIYADPPYLLSTRSQRLYACEMDEPGHMELLDALDDHPGPVLLSGYASEMYDQRLTHWTRRTTGAQAQLGRKREEVIWMNKAVSGIQVSLID